MEGDSTIKVNARGKGKSTASFPVLLLRIIPFLFFHFFYQFLTLFSLLALEIDTVLGLLGWLYLRSLNVKFYRFKDDPKQSWPLLTPKSSPSGKNKEKRMFLPNHRSFGDFYVDAGAMGFRATFLSRALVAVALPTTFPLGKLLGFAYFFNRKQSKKLKPEELATASKEVKDRELKKRQASIARSTAVLDAAFDEPWSTVVVYPEGTRLRGKNPGQLRTGALRYAYLRQIPCQVVISTNKEYILDELNFTCQRSKNVVTSVGNVIDPTKFASVENFIDEIKKSFHTVWTKAYSKTPETHPNDFIEYNPWDNISESERKAVRSTFKGRLTKCLGILSWIALGYYFVSAYGLHKLF